ncbi:related to coenzyme F420-dependent N5,N10-methylene tetrahydromethanopterin reductase and related flavin-dependent oxidoreductases [Phialocephala subalpina]|uniref:Related to coenzyme F420-dependent N5,N10-methylene tetrahydromethanopterin reductase and related flavin-dependent oxidoreductases n=1 Tax=Phialocephala subalpina TaxID=576137 RepID=A0A1L7X2V2_9HELO|nr:related to coenzyme F420-dependent N5,N10-methylene tetrahydromethanopterin reductase and related flavin-dependent oxidoreductases [Phialocephala subalpina]
MAVQSPKKKWIMNAFAMFTPGHLSPGQWRHPEDRAGDYSDLDYWTDLAKILEAGKFHGLFLADHLGIYDVYKGPGNSVPALESGAQFPLGDPFLLISAMAAATKSLSFAVTASTTYENPAAKAFGFDEQIPHDQRYERAEEYLEVVYKILEGSWKEDSRIMDAALGRYSASDRVRAIEHSGKYFKIKATHQLHPSVQRTPFILQAGASSAGKNFASKHSEAMFLPGLEPHKVRKEADDIRGYAADETISARLAAHGRPKSSLKLLAGVLVIVDETDEKAQAKYQSYLQYADLEGTAALFGGWTDHDLSKYGEDEDFKFTGSGAIQSMVNTWSATIPGGFEDMIKYLWPELRKRGLFWDDYEKVGGSMRESYLGDEQGPKLREGHPGLAYKWVD